MTAPLGYDLFAPGDDITDVRLNNLERQSVIVEEDAGAPTDPHEGMKRYVPTTRENLEYVTATVGWSRYWRMPWGRMGDATDASLHSGVVGAIVVASIDGFTSVANRLVRVTWSGSVTGHGSPAAVPLLDVKRSFNGGSDTSIGAPWSETVIDGATAMFCQTTTNLLDAAGTYVFYLVASCGTNNFDVNGNVCVTKLIVEDIGPGMSPDDEPTP